MRTAAAWCRVTFEKATAGCRGVAQQIVYGMIGEEKVQMDHVAFATTLLRSRLTEMVDDCIQQGTRIVALDYIIRPLWGSIFGPHYSKDWLFRVSLFQNGAQCFRIGSAGMAIQNKSIHFESLGGG